MDTEALTSISLFSGAGGLDIGLEKEGFRTLAFVEVNRQAQDTLEANRSYFPLAHMPPLGDITGLTPDDVLEAAGVQPRQPTLLAGGPPCQSFSTAGRRGSIADPRGGLFDHFVTMVEEIQPRFFVLENVRGILSAALRHRPLHLRGPDHEALAEEEELGSLLTKVILPTLRGRLKYEVVYGLVNAADYGVPQLRQRVLFLGSRDREFGSRESQPDGMHLAELMPPTHAKEPTPGGRRWVTLGSALEGLADEAPEITQYSAARKKVFQQIPEGKNWRHLRDAGRHRYLRKVMGGAYGATGGRVGFWRRLTFSKPCPTLPTSPVQKGTGLCHPVETRPLSVLEYARIQEFPDKYRIEGSVAQKYTQIGNAVPLGLGRAVGRCIKNVISGSERPGEPRVDHAVAAATG